MCTFRLSVFCLVCFSSFRESCRTLPQNSYQWGCSFPKWTTTTDVQPSPPVWHHRLHQGSIPSADTGLGRHARQEVHVHVMRLFLTFVALQCQKTICTHSFLPRRQLNSTFSCGPTSTLSFNSKYSAKDLV